MNAPDLHTETSSDGVIEREFAVDGIPGTLWSPTDPTDPPALILMGHGGGLHRRLPAQIRRAEQSVRAHGFTVASIDAPGHGGRPRSADDETWVAAIGHARRNGEPLAPIIADLNSSLAERAVPEWRRVLDALQQLPDIGTDTPVGYAGMTLGTAIGIPLVAADSRISAAMFGGYFDYDSLVESARRVTIPVDVIVSWDDPEIPRDAALRLFDAIGSDDKMLRAHVGTHKRIPAHEGEHTALFFRQHLRGE
ncbi:dienelactone hydrolase family protein [Gordonia sp. OPL2]|uniref:dienelactone hydrolase family protein n=1 Tax=Gordonia sp. OPL2 TaxID=2486274 RepID=UPI0021CC633E|nr:alpha/beta hydrolase [Gordonia sp. OPL2]